MTEQQERLQHYLDELEQGASLASLLETVPEDESEVRTLLMLAATLTTTSHPQPSVLRAAEARHRLHTAFADLQASAPAESKRPFWRWPAIRPLLLAEGFALLLVVAIGLWAFTSRGEWMAGINTLGQTSTPATTVQPATSTLVFEPRMLTLTGCDDRFLLAATLRNDATLAGSAVHNVELGYTVSQGALYLQSVQLAPTHWDEIAAGDQATIAAQLALAGAWQTAADGSTVRLRLFALPEEAGNTTQPSATLDVSLRRQCEAQAQPAASPLPTPLPSLTPSAVVDEVALPTVRGFEVEEADRKEAEEREIEPEDRIYCEGSSRHHPAATQLAGQLDLPYEEIIRWFCQGFGLGEIQMAHSISTQVDATIEEVMALRAAGYGWGQIMIQLGLIRGANPPTPSSETDP